MIGRILVALLLLAAAFTSGSAEAQSPVCEGLRAELARLGTGSARNASRALQQQRAALGRLRAYYASIGCDRPDIPFFGPSRNPQCAGIAQQVRSAQMEYERLASESDGGDGRRQQLQAAIAELCQPGRGLDAPQTGLRANPFGDDESGAEPYHIIIEDPEESAPRPGGPRVLCVRACDGYVFPLSTPIGREGADNLCQALCPGAETSAFRAPAGALDLDRASRNGEPYRALANAFRYQKRLVPGCACKSEDQSWSQVLQGAEEMLDRQDNVVSAAEAEAMSRPKAGKTAKTAAPSRAAPVKARKAAASKVPATGREADALGQPAGRLGLRVEPDVPTLDPF